MKNLNLIVLFLISFIFCEAEDNNSLAGVKYIINDELIDLLIPYFEYYIKKNVTEKKSITNNKFESILFKNLEFQINNFSIDKFKLNFDEDGSLNLRFNNIQAVFSGTFHTIVISKFSANLYNFYIEQNFKIKSKYSEQGVYVPYFESNENPKIKFDYITKLGEDQREFAYLNELINNGDFTKEFILPNIINLNINILNTVIEQFYKEFSFGTYYGVDLNMTSPIEYRNKSIQINAYGLFYYKSNNKTHNLTRYPLSKFPSIENNKIGQIYISSYAISSSLYTEISTNRNDKIRFSPNVRDLDIMLHDTLNKIGYETINAIFNLRPDVEVECLDGYLNITIPGTLEFKTAKNDTPFFIIDSKLIMKGLFSLYNNPNFRLEIDDLNIKILDVIRNDINEYHLYGILNYHFESSFFAIRNLFTKELNNFLSSNYMSIPNNMNIQFYDISFEHKKQYVILNFDLKKAYS